MSLSLLSSSSFSSSNPDISTLSLPWSTSSTSLPISSSLNSLPLFTPIVKLSMKSSDSFSIWIDGDDSIEESLFRSEITKEDNGL